MSKGKPWLSRLRGLLNPVRKPRRKKKEPRHLYAVIDHIMVPALHSGEADKIERIIDQLNPKDIGRLNKSTIMGISRLLIKSGRLKTVERLISAYLSKSRHESLYLYFLEPLAELDAMGGLTEVPLIKFCAQFRPPSSALALDWLNKEYRPADEADRRNFQRCILAPLRVLSEEPGNLMDIRFSAEQRADLQAKITSALIEERPLSLLRLGDGEAYPYPAPELEGIEPAIIQKDNENFERNYLGSGTAVDLDRARQALIRSFRQAVARCDILGFPSVYRIIRNLTPPHSRYGMRRNQRAFLRILSALGECIPVGGKLFTEERCHRIRGAIDEPFVLRLADKARSVVLVSSWPEIQSRFSTQSSLIAVTPNRATLYEAYPKIIERIRELSGPGTLVLIGAGVPAKIMADQAREAGAVALDVGSLMDYMVGHKTRTIADLT